MADLGSKKTLNIVECFFNSQSPYDIIDTTFYYFLSCNSYRLGQARFVIEIVVMKLNPMSSFQASAAPAGLSA
jgi:hypothetical protein